MTSSPLFMLCAMRSYSSLVSTMLGQHPDLYGLPEINLSVSDSLAGVLTFYQRRPHGLHGLLRVIAQLNRGEQTDETIAEARAFLTERQDWSTDKMLDWIESRVAPRRIVDKSPVSVRNIDMMRRLYRMRPDAQFLHVVRQPAAVCRSIDRLHEDIDAQTGSNLRAMANAEQIWLRSNSNIMAFKAELPPGQCLTLRGEDLLTDVAFYGRQICEWLGIRQDPAAIDAMLHPDQSPYAALGPESAKYGNDPNFLADPVFRQRPIEEEPVDAGVYDRPFQPATRKLARELGYA